MLRAIKTIIDRIIEDVESEKKRRAKLTRWERFKEDLPDNMLFITTIAFVLYVFVFLPIYGFYHLIM